VHVHNADESIPTPSLTRQAIWRPTLRRICLANADCIAANSDHSLDTFLAGRRRRPFCDRVHYLGIDPTPFASAVGRRSTLRRQLGLSEEARILLFAGRMTPEKNPLFAVDVLAELRQYDPSVIGMFVGAGSLETAVRAHVRKLGQEEAVRFMGWREDVPEIMAASDWFILPHPEEPKEGFGIAVVEAQLAGLRLLLSKGVTDAPLLPNAVFRRLSIGDHPALWAEAAIELWSESMPSHADTFSSFRDSPMNLDHALPALLQLYE
jgi:glycosyltransferase involved in cell wall biosynthesis